MSIYGDIVIGGQIISPDVGEVLVTTAEGDLDQLTSIDIRFTINTTIMGEFILGLYHENDVPVDGKIQIVNVSACVVHQTIWEDIRIEVGQKLKIVSSGQILTAVVQGTINYS